jgi:hypothetical protein
VELKLLSFGTYTTPDPIAASHFQSGGRRNEMRQFKVLTTRRFGRALALAIGLAPILTMTASHAQEKPAIPMSVPDDWTHRHLIFSGPQSQADADRMRTDPRYWHQWLTHNLQTKTGGKAAAARILNNPDASSSLAGMVQSAGTHGKPQPGTTPSSTRDWGTSLGAGGLVGNGMFPAKFSFDVTAIPSCDNDFVVYNTSLAGTAGTIASQTGTFTASSISGTVVVAGVTLTASPGTAASQSTTISSNGVAAGKTITITNGASNVSVTASAPVAQVQRVTFNGTLPDDGSSITVATIDYVMKQANWTSGTPTSTECFIRTSATTSDMVSRLTSAINTTGTGGSTSTWECGTGATQPGNGGKIAATTSPNLDVTAKLAGTTGVVMTRTNGSGKDAQVSAVSVQTAGSDGSSTSPNFVYWSGAAPIASTTTLATNIRSAFTAQAATATVGVAVTGSTNVVIITASATGTVGSSINVATTIDSGLTGSAFNGNLTGGAPGTTSSTTFSTSTDSTTTSTNLLNEAAALASAITANSTASAAVTATSASGTVTVTSKTAGASTIGTTETFSAGFTWGGTTLAGGADGKPSIIAFNQLYSSQGGVTGLCPSDGPNVMWAYNTGTGNVVTSPVLSLDGKEIMYVETKASGAVLHILRWKAGEGTLGAPVAPTNVVGGFDLCPVNTESCDARITLLGPTQVANSAPFYDYSRDTLYVGDNNGKLHKFSGVLLGTSAEAAAPWPLALAASTVTLSSPVLDWGSGNIFVGDAAGTLWYVRESFSSSGACASGNAPCVGTPSQALTGSIVDAPIVDGSTHKVFVFDGKDTALNGSVHQFDSALSSGSHRTVDVGGTTATTGANIHAGAFDQAYMTSAAGTGHLFVCGKNIAAGNQPALHRITITNGLLNTASDSTPTASDGTPLVLVSANGPECSPVTELYNTNTGIDSIFFSVGASTSTAAGFSTAGCTNPSGATGCLMSLNLTGLVGATFAPAGPTSGYPLPTVATSAGSSGIVVDNVAAGTATTLGLPGIATAVGLSTTVGVSTTTAALSTSTNTSGTTATVTTSLGDGTTGGCPSPGTSCALTTSSGQASRFVLNEYISIGTEIMKITAIPDSSHLTVSRAQVGTPFSVHTANWTAQLVTSSASAIIRVAGTTSFAAGDTVQIDSELITIGATGTCGSANTPCFTGVTRAVTGGGAAAGHNTAITVAKVLAPTPTSIVVGSTAAFAPGDYISVDSETMLISSPIPDSTHLNVTRGQLGTTAVYHVFGFAITEPVLNTTQTTIAVASTTGFANGDYIQVGGSEIMQINAAVTNATHLTVSRGALGTTPATSAMLAAVTAPILSTGQTTIVVASATGFAANDYILVDSEKMQIGTVSTNHFTVSRAQLGTTANTHASGATVTDLTSAANDTTLTVGSTTGFTQGDYVQVDSEIMQVGSGSTSTVLVVTRGGLLGTTAATHTSPAAVVDVTGPNTSSIYFSFGGNSVATNRPCYQTAGVGCAVKLTQLGLK